MRGLRRLIFLVSPAHRELYASLTRTFAQDDTVQVVLDRRRTDRRRKGEHVAGDRRRVERRRNTDVQHKLTARGYAVVGIIAAKPVRRS
jgi:hypothetical protein